MAVKLCYNRGCGKEYNIKENVAESCCYHPGAPYFHDAYKGWTCCQAKSTDFTTFLNTPGCTLGKHSSVKPPEPEKITGNLTKEESPEKVIEVRPPIQAALKRPDYSSCPMERLIPTIAQSARTAVAGLLAAKPVEVNGDGEAEVAVGTTCKNNGCKVVYPCEGECKYHPGYPVFHEGMKYWSCCQRKTSEFQQFMEQEGCTIGKHKWVDDKKGTEVVCRYDWHQTASTVTVAIYAKKYDPELSTIELGAVRLKVELRFPANNETFKLDLELGGLVDVSKGSCSAGMYGTKVEIKMKKAESGSWSKLDLPPKFKAAPSNDKEEIINTEPENNVDALELDDLDLTPTRYTLSKEAKTAAKY